MNMMATLEALLAGLTPGQLSRLRPAELQRLADALYGNHVLAMMQLGEKPFPRVTYRADEKPDDKPAAEAPAGVLRALKDGERSP